MPWLGLELPTFTSEVHCANDWGCHEIYYYIVIILLILCNMGSGDPKPDISSATDFPILKIWSDYKTF